LLTGLSTVYCLLAVCAAVLTGRLAVLTRRLAVLARGLAVLAVHAVLAARLAVLAVHAVLAAGLTVLAVHAVLAGEGTAEATVDAVCSLVADVVDATHQAVEAVADCVLRTLGECGRDGVSCVQAGVGNVAGCADNAADGAVEAGKNTAVLACRAPRCVDHCF